MRKTTVSYFENFDYKLDSVWSGIVAEPIAVINWEAFPHLPKVSFKLAHDGDTLFIQYSVIEPEEVRVECVDDQDPVYQDSCVEFFIETPNGEYHNFEFNSKGVMLSAKGKERTNRISRSASELPQITRVPSGVKNTQGLNAWTLTVGIPFAVLGLVRGHAYKANFYKCGDLTAKKHYVSWSPIDTPKPNFHVPQYFGELVLA